MGEYGFLLTRILLYKDKIEDFVLIQENTVKTRILAYFMQCFINFLQQC